MPTATIDTEKASFCAIGVAFWASVNDDLLMLHGRMLRYLDEVARAGSIRQAALRLNVAASAINRQLIALEEDLGGALFERLPRGLRLTAMGEILLAHVRETMASYELATDRIAQLRGLLRGKIVVGTMGGLAAGLLADAILAFRQKHPWVRLVVRVLSREALIAAVLAGEIDLGLAYDMERSPRLHVVARAEQQVGAVIAPSHPLADRAVVRMTECLAFPLVIAERPMSLRRTTELLVPASVDLRPVLETSSIELMKRFARIVPNVAILNHADVRVDLSDGALRFVPLSEGGAHQTITIFHRSAGAPEASVSVMAREIETVLLHGSGRVPS
jgi:DNA-binding transcriptional LysR family regulator